MARCGAACSPHTLTHAVGWVSLGNMKVFEVSVFMPVAVWTFSLLLLLSSLFQGIQNLVVHIPIQGIYSFSK